MYRGATFLAEENFSLPGLLHPARPLVDAFVWTYAVSFMQKTALKTKEVSYV